MKIAVIGTGYVGLVTGAGFAEFGHDVACVDIDAKRIARSAMASSRSSSPGFRSSSRRNVAVGRLTFTTDTTEAMQGAQVAFIAVGTPSGDGWQRRLSYVDPRRATSAAHDELHGRRDEEHGPGRHRGPRALDVLAATAKHPFAVASNPEFLKEGDAVSDFLKPARVIVGVDDPSAEELLRELYRGVLLTNDRMQVMDIRSAELTKYAANAMLATRISFMNELARLCELVGADIDAIRKGIGADPRIGNKFLFAGAGFGGSLLPEGHPRARAHRARGRTQLEVVEAVQRANERQKRVARRARARALGGEFAARGSRSGASRSSPRPTTSANRPR